MKSEGLSKHIRSKKGLAIALSKLSGFDMADVRREQYMTDSNIAAEIVWNALFKGYIEGKVIVDLGCGTGILGLGCLLCGAKKVYFVDIDADVLKIAQNNLKLLKSEGFELEGAEFVNKDIKKLGGFKENIDLVIENPPFGTKSEHIDREFLKKAFSLSDMVYSFHKSETERFVEAFSKDEGYFIVERLRYKFPLKKTMKFHTKKVKFIDVSCWLLSKKE